MLVGASASFALGAVLVSAGVAGQLWASRQSAADRELLLGKIESLEESIELHEETERLASVGGWSLQIGSQEPMWSRAVRRIHDVPDDYAPTLETAIDFYAPDAREVIRKAVDKGIERREGWDLELPLITASGREIWVRAIGRPVFRDGELVTLRGALQDISGRKEAEAALQRLDRRLEFAMQAGRLGLWDWDLETDRVYYSDRYFQMLGHEPAEFSGDFATWDSLVHPEDKPAALNAIHAYQAGETDRYRAEFRMRTADGSWRWTMAIGENQKGEIGEPARMIGVHIDIDEVKRVQEEIALARRAAEAANRSKSEFVANMSHEIRTPMTSIVGYAELLGSSDISPEDRETHIDAVERNSRHLLGLINQILDLSKIEAGKMEIEHLTVSPCELLRDVRSVFAQRALDKGLELSVSASGPMPDEIKTDPTRLRQVLVNLVGNALKFTHEGFVRMQARITSDGLLELCVEDSGLGIEESAQEALFEAFSQADASITRNFGGTGLGLAISKRIAELLGGSIEVESEFGIGSRFKVTIDPGPLDSVRWIDTVDFSPAPPRGARRGHHQKFRLSGRILVAEDGRDNQRLIELILKKTGLEVELVENGQLAVDRLTNAAQTDPPIDLVLMDLQMPVLDGLSAARALRARGIELPIVALTANATQEDRRLCEAGGFTEFCTKPIDRTHLLRSIERLLPAVDAS